MLRRVAAIALLFAAQTREPRTAEGDHADMLRRLGIERLRPGPSGDPKATDAANTDEARANPHPDWPELLRMADGRRVTRAAQWPARRAELTALFEREVFGRIPAGVPAVRWSASAAEARRIGARDALVQSLAGAIDNRAFPTLAVTIRATLVLPAARRGRAPVLVMFAPPRWVTAEADPRVAELVAAGWGVVLLDPGSIQADSGAGLREGIIGLVNRGQPRAPGDWGALRAWAWGASRTLDYLRTRAEIDGGAIGVEGVSRYGKAALVTAAFDERFAMALIGSAGEGGVSPYRRDFGEALENIAGSGEYHWMAGSFLRYAQVGGRTAADLPVEAHELIALVAPRLLFVSYGVPERGDALWLDQRGSFMAGVAAGPAWRLLGRRDLGVGGDYRTAAPPPVLTGLTAGELAWRQHGGGHTDAPNIGAFIAWAEEKLGRR